MATFIKSSCECCPPTVCDGCEQPCNLFPASLYEKYIENPDNLPPEIYLGGQRQYSDQQAVGYLFDNEVTARVWGGVTGGQLVSRAGIGYGDLIFYGDPTNGVFLEPIDSENLSAGYTWAVYRGGVRSTAEFLIDGINRHDAFASSYSVTADVPFLDEDHPYAGDGQFTIHRVGCGTWDELKYVNTGYYLCDENPDPFGPSGFITTSNPAFYLGGMSEDGLVYTGAGGGGNWSTTATVHIDCSQAAWVATRYVLIPGTALNGPWGTGIQGDWIVPGYTDQVIYSVS